jgi:hypothetical protein
MKKPRLLILLAASLLLFCLAGCSAHSLNAAGTVYDLCQRNLNDESFAELCDRTLAPAALDGFFDGIVDAGGQYVVIPDGAAIYRTLEGGAPVLDESTNCIGVYAGTNKLHINAQGYAMVVYDAEKDTYRVIDLVLQPVE